MHLYSEQSISIGSDIVSHQTTGRSESLPDVLKTTETTDAFAADSDSTGNRVTDGVIERYIGVGSELNSKRISKSNIISSLSLLLH